jgi:hypothetical protein
VSDTFANNARILQGDRKALHETGVYYVIPTESIGGNAGPDRFAVNGYVDSQTGRILAIGNPQDIPVEIKAQGVRVTFHIELPSLKKLLATPPAKEKIVAVSTSSKKPLSPEAQAVLEGLKGIPFILPPHGASEHTIDGRKPSRPLP